MAFDQSTPFFIVSCDKSGGYFFSTSRFALNRHTAKQHPAKPPKSKTLKKCQRCDYLTDDSGSLKKHENNCLKHCPFKNKAIEELRKHRRTHPHTLQPKKCTMGSCGFKGSHYLLTKHLENIHGVTKPKALEYLSRFLTKPNQSENLEKCQRCDHISTKESIRKHWKIFSKTEELFHCGASLCKKCFCSEISRSLHSKRTHPEFQLNKCQR